jgi:hypothetical protein
MAGAAAEAILLAAAIEKAKGDKAKVRKAYLSASGRRNTIMISSSRQRCRQRRRAIRTRARHPVLLARRRGTWHGIDDRRNRSPRGDISSAATSAVSLAQLAEIVPDLRVLAVAFSQNGYRFRLKKAPCRIWLDCVSCAPFGHGSSVGNVQRGSVHRRVLGNLAQGDRARHQ